VIKTNKTCLCHDDSYSKKKKVEEAFYDQTHNIHGHFVINCVSCRRPDTAEKIL